MNRDNTKDPTPFAVYCNGDALGEQLSCGLVFLSETEYEKQLDKPDLLWCCPKCGSSAEWDDWCQATNPPEEEEK